MSDKIRAMFDRVESEQQALDLPPDGTSLTLLQKVYRSAALPLTTRMRAAMAALQFEHPKLGVQVSINDDGSFAARLDLAIARSNGHPKLIEHRANEGSTQHPASELKEPLPTPLATPLHRRA